MTVYIHALREEGDLFRLAQLIKAGEISIHALREEGDPLTICWKGSRIIFLSTPSARRATRLHAAALAGQGISIHALREEGDGCHEIRQTTS